MIYDEAPIGTVLRAPSGLVYVKTRGDIDTGFPWARVVPTRGVTEWLDNDELPLDLVELVDKPDLLLAPVNPPKIVDRDGDLWELRGSRYHLPGCPDGCGSGVLREAIDRISGPTTAVTP